MKESIYNIYVNHNNQCILFNSRTVATAILDMQAKSLLQSIRNGSEVLQTDLVSKMKEAGYLIEDDVNELHQLEMEYLFEKYQKAGLALVIAPTMTCNFECPYCYEGEQKGVMSKNTQESVVSFVSKFAKENQNIHITWFGGEPLLVKNIIYGLSDRFMNICHNENVEYEAEIITNGYLLDRETVFKLQKYKINFIQVTIDGLPETHNKRRKLKGCNENNTYDRIVENIRFAKEQGINVSIRVNIDRQTISEIDQIMDNMIQNGFENEVYLGQLECNTMECDLLSDSCLNNEEYAETCINFERRKLLQEIEISYPKPKNINCGADYLYSYVIDSEGFMYKCWNDIGIKQKSIGNLDDYYNVIHNPNANYSKWMIWSPFQYDKCRECKLLPICMGGCSYNGNMAGAPLCECRLSELEEYIKLKCDEVGSMHSANDKDEK